MGLDGLLERKLPVDLRTHQAVDSQLVDVLQRAFDGLAVLLDPEFRLPGEVAQAMQEKLEVLLEGRADR